MAAGDVIELRGLRVLGRHGALAGEQDREQPFEVDIDLEVDLAGAARSDDLADTVDYGAMARVAAAVVEGPSCHLLEAVAGRIADAMLADGRVTATTVTVRKLRPPVPVDLATAGVRLIRRRTAEGSPTGEPVARAARRRSRQEREAQGPPAGGGRRRPAPGVTDPRHG